MENINNPSKSDSALSQSRYPGEQEVFDKLFAAEDRHFWFRARNKIIAAAVTRATSSLPTGYRVLEIGCGTGNVLRVLEQNAGSDRVFGIDLFSGGFKYARQRTDCALIQGDMYCLPFTIRFDVIGMFDVIEHLADDLMALRQVHRALKSGGKLLLTVPAHKKLWSYADEAAGHYRRYEADVLAQVLRSAGFDIEYLTECMAAVLPLLWFKRKLLTKLAPRGPMKPKERFLKELRITPVLNGVLQWILDQEAIFVRAGRKLPFGTSLLAIARK